MTVGECIKNWLETYEDIDFSQLATDFVDSDLGSYGIFKSPSKETVKCISGDSIVTEYYQFFGRMATNLENERIDNEQVLADFEDWVETQDLEENYPDLSTVGKYECEEIAITNSATIIDQKDNEALYQITVGITYVKEI